MPDQTNSRSQMACLLAILCKRMKEFHNISGYVGHDTGNNLEHLGDVGFNPLDSFVFRLSGSMFGSIVLASVVLAKPPSKSELCLVIISYTKITYRCLKLG